MRAVGYRSRTCERTPKNSSWGEHTAVANDDRPRAATLQPCASCLAGDEQAELARLPQALQDDPTNADPAVQRLAHGPRRSRARRRAASREGHLRAHVPEELLGITEQLGRARYLIPAPEAISDLATGSPELQDPHPPVARRSHRLRESGPKREERMEACTEDENGKRTGWSWI